MVRYLKHNAILFSIILIKLTIGLSVIDFHSIDLDEPFSIFHSQKSLVELFDLFKSENNPPLHFILLHFWQSLFGDSIVSVRSLSLIFSVLTIPIFWQVGKRINPITAPIMLCIFFVFSDYHHFHSIEARTYSLLVFLYSALILCLQNIILDSNKDTKQYVLLTSINILLFYTHYIFPFILLSELALLILFHKSFSIRKSIIGALFFLGAVVPWISVLMTRSKTVNTSGTWVPDAQLSELYGNINKFMNDKWVFAAVIGGMFLSFILSRFDFGLKRIRSKQFLVPLLLFSTPYLSIFILSYFTPYDLFLDRYLYFLSIPLFLLIIHYFDYFKGKGKGYSLLLVILAVFVLKFNFYPDNNRESDNMAEYALSSGEKTFVIAPAYYDLTFVYHYDKELFRNTTDYPDWTNKGIFRFDENFDLSVFSETHNSFLLIDADQQFTVKDNNPENYFSEKFEKVKEEKFKGNYRILTFSKIISEQ
jgi:mannosyltransferase